MRTLDKVERDKVSISGIVETLGKVENKSNKNTVERIERLTRKVREKGGFGDRRNKFSTLISY
jgi:hypothetical protein